MRVDTSAVDNRIWERVCNTFLPGEVFTIEEAARAVSRDEAPVPLVHGGGRPYSGTKRRVEARTLEALERSLEQTSDITRLPDGRWMLTDA